MDHDLLKKLNIKWPLIVAPMAGGPTTPYLVAESCRAGVLGSIGGAYSNAQSILDFSAKVRAQTNANFAINLFIPHNIQVVSDQDLTKSLNGLREFRRELQIPDPVIAPPYEENFEQQFEAVLKIRPRVFSFIFGLLDADRIQELRRQNIISMGTATTLEEAQQLEANGVDAIVLQGFESGGHRGTFDASTPDPEVPIFKLLEQCSSKIKIPYIAAGGIMTAEQLQLALKKGAALVQMGTAFLACKEAGTSAAYRKELLESPNRITKTTRAFSGRLARGIENRFMQEVELHPESILPFPAQNKMTRDIRNTAATKGNPDYLSLWSGSGQGELWTGSTRELIQKLFQ